MPSENAHSPQRSKTLHADDLRLAQRMLSGDAVAWQDFLDSHGRIIRARVADVAVSFGQGADASAIDDATADVFAALLGNKSAALRAFVGRSSMSTYVAVIATRCATRGFARKRQLQFAAASANSHPCDASPEPIRELIDIEQQQRVRALLDELPEKQREIVKLFHLEGFSYARISQELDIPIGSVGVTLRRAEVRLRERLEMD